MFFAKEYADFYVHIFLNVFIKGLVVPKNVK